MASTDEGAPRLRRLRPPWIGPAPGGAGRNAWCEGCQTGAHVAIPARRAACVARRWRPRRRVSSGALRRTAAAGRRAARLGTPIPSRSRASFRRGRVSSGDLIAAADRRRRDRALAALLAAVRAGRGRTRRDRPGSTAIRAPGRSRSRSSATGDARAAAPRMELALAAQDERRGSLALARCRAWRLEGAMRPSSRAWRFAGRRAGTRVLAVTLSQTPGRPTRTRSRPRAEAGRARGILERTHRGAARVGPARRAHRSRGARRASSPTSTCRCCARPRTCSSTRRSGTAR